VKERAAEAAAAVEGDAQVGASTAERMCRPFHLLNEKSTSNNIWCLHIGPLHAAYIINFCG